MDGALSRTVNVDDPPPVAEGWWAVAVARLVDEQTRLPVLSASASVAEPRSLTATVGDEAVLAIVGRPWFACPPLLAVSYDITVTIRAPEYVTTDVVITLPSAQRHVAAPAPNAGATVLTLDSVAGLRPGQILEIGPAGGDERAVIRNLGPGPLDVTLDVGLHFAHPLNAPVVADAWTTVDLGAFELRREPTVLRGRTVRLDPLTGTSTAVVGATIAVTDFWTSHADLRAQLPGWMNQPNPALRMFPAGLSPGVVAARSVGPAQISNIPLPPAAPNDERRLSDSAPAGSTGARIDHRAGIVPPAVLRIDPDEGEASEAVTATAVVAFAPPNGPGDFTLALPLRRPHLAGARVVPLAPGVAGPNAAVRSDVRAGDRTVFVDSLASLPDDSDVQLTGGAAPREFQLLRHYVATSGVGGYFALPPLHRVAAISLIATAPLLVPVPFTVYPDDEVREQFLDVVFA